VKPYHRTVLTRALATTATVCSLGTAALVGAGPAGARDAEDCRGYAPIAHPFVKVVAADDAFDTDCILAPADRSFRIYLRNNDGEVPHNISIYSADPDKDEAAEQLYKGKPVKAPGQEEYAVDALPSGRYYFRDDKVPAMHGEIQVPGKK
jgi:hypothetical protein